MRLYVLGGDVSLLLGSSVVRLDGLVRRRSSGRVCVFSWLRFLQTSYKLWVLGPFLRLVCGRFCFLNPLGLLIPSCRLWVLFLTLCFLDGQVIPSSLPSLCRLYSLLSFLSSPGLRVPCRPVFLALSFWAGDQDLWVCVLPFIVLEVPNSFSFLRLFPRLCVIDSSLPPLVWVGLELPCRQSPLLRLVWFLPCRLRKHLSFLRGRRLSCDPRSLSCVLNRGELFVRHPLLWSQWFWVLVGQLLLLPMVPLLGLSGKCVSLLPRRLWGLSDRSLLPLSSSLCPLDGHVPLRVSVPLVVPLRHVPPVLLLGLWVSVPCGPLFLSRDLRHHGRQSPLLHVECLLVLVGRSPLVFLVPGPWFPGPRRHLGLPVGLRVLRCRPLLLSFRDLYL